MDTPQEETSAESQAASQENPTGDNGAVPMDVDNGAAAAEMPVAGGAEQKVATPPADGAVPDYGAAAGSTAMQNKSREPCRLIGGECRRLIDPQ